MKTAVEVKEGVEAFLKQLDGAQSDKEMRAIFKTFQLELDVDLPADPYSEAYRERQLEIYQWLHGSDYVVSNETTDFDPKTLARKPFPFIHESAPLVADQLMGIGFLIKCMDLPPGAKILEFGPGWGNTSITLAKMGYEVTAIDIEPNFVELLKERASLECISNLYPRVGQFFDIENYDSGYFDAILFYECFHHCDDHHRLISSFENVLSEGGIACFAAEPIVEDFPIPWGLRMDGESVWAISRNGWMELGFRSDYFAEMLERAGWGCDTYQGSDSPLASVRIARRMTEQRFCWAFNDGALQSEIGEKSANGVVASGGDGYLMYGPYVTLSAGRYRGLTTIEKLGSLRGDLVLDVVSDGGTKSHARRSLKISDQITGPLDIPFQIDSATSNIEVRIYSRGASGFALISLEVQKNLGAPVARTDHEFDS